MPAFTLIDKHTRHSKLLRGAVLLFAGKGITQVCSFLRNVIVARVVGVEEFGIAVTFSITIAVFDMVGSLSVDKLLIQAQDGDSGKLQSAAHAVQAARGALSALIILLCAAPIARWFGVPDATWAFRYLALVPLLHGLVHLDLQRMQRELDFRSAIKLEIAHQLIPTLLAWPLAAWLRDFSAMLWLVVIQSAIGTIGSFMLARRSYRWCWCLAYLGRFLSFGWPLMVNAILLFGVFHGDRFVIASAPQLFGSAGYSLTDLGVYSVAVSLTLLPTMTLGNISSSLLLPVFSRLQADRVEFRRQYERACQVLAFLGGLFTIIFVVAGGHIVTAIYGGQYSEAATVIGWLAVAQCMRMARFSPTIAAMAYGNTANGMYSNFARTVGIAASVWVVASGAPLLWIAISAFAGEVAAFVVSLLNLREKHEMPVSGGIIAIVPLGVVAALAAAAVHYSSSASFGMIAVLLIAFSLLFAAMMFLMFPALRPFAQLRHVLGTKRRLVGTPSLANQ